MFILVSRLGCELSGDDTHHSAVESDHRISHGTRTVSLILV
jgi:hypothetical protein